MPAAVLSWLASRNYLSFHLASRVKSLFGRYERLFGFGRLYDFILNQ